MVILQALGIIVAALAPAFIWLFFFLKEDEHPEPAKLLIKVFSMGMLASIPAFAIQLFLEKGIGITDGVVWVIFLFGAIEELFKFFAAYVVVNNNPDFDEPVDGMIYMVVAGLGFATIENIFVIGSLLQLSGANVLLGAGETFFLRLIGATLLHTLASALIGYHWSKGILKNEKTLFISIGLAIAFLVHGSFNYLVHIFQEVNLLIPSVFLVGVSFFVFSDFEKLKDTQP